MKKKLSVSTAVAIALVTALLTFQITFVATMGAVSDAHSTGDTSLAEGDFLSDALEKLREVDSKFRGLYIGDLDNKELEDYIIKGYVAGTGDMYAAYYNADEYADYISDLYGEGVGIGINVIYNSEERCIEIINIMPDSPALEAGLAPGDLIVYVGEEKLAVADIGYEAAIAAMKGDEGTTAHFSVLKSGDTSLTEFAVTRAKVENVNIFSRVCDLDKTVGVIKMTGFDANTPDQFKTALSDLHEEGCTSFIVDMRYNPGGELNSVVDTLDYLLPEGPIIRIFDADDNLVQQYDSDKECVDIKMAIIVNGSTASAAELFTSAMMDYDRAVVVGETTYGKGCMQTTVPLSSGGALSVTFRMYKPPYSEGYHGVGIKPDIEVPLDEALLDKNIYKITDEEDNQLRAALEALKAE